MRLPSRGRASRDVAATEPVRPEQHFTQPPPRYSEPRWWRTSGAEHLRDHRHDIVDREYVTRDKGRLAPTIWARP